MENNSYKRGDDVAILYGHYAGLRGVVSSVTSTHYMVDVSLDEMCCVSWNTNSVMFEIAQADACLKKIEKNGIR